MKRCSQYIGLFALALVATLLPDRLTAITYSCSEPQRSKLDSPPDTLRFHVDSSSDNVIVDVTFPTTVSDLPFVTVLADVADTHFYSFDVSTTPTSNDSEPTERGFSFEAQPQALDKIEFTFIYAERTTCPSEVIKYTLRIPSNAP